MHTFKKKHTKKTPNPPACFEPMPLIAFSRIESEHHVIPSDSQSYFSSPLLFVVHMIRLRGQIQDKLRIPVCTCDSMQQSSFFKRP